MSEEDITNNTNLPKFSGQAVIRKFYFLLEGEQRKVCCLLGTLKRIQFTPQTLTEQGGDVYEMTQSQFEGLNVPLALDSESIASEVGSTLQSICNRLNEISGRMNIDEFGEKFLLDRIDIVCNKLGFYDASLQQVLLRFQPLIEKQHFDIELDALLLSDVKTELGVLADFPFLYIEGFDSDSYVAAYPDLVLALATGVFAAPVIHFVKHGYNEIADGTRKLSGDNPVHALVFGSSETGATIQAADNSLVNLDQGSDEINIGTQDSGTLPQDPVIVQRLEALSDKAKLFVESVRESGFVDQDWYAGKYGESADIVADFLFNGLPDGASPCFLFEPHWYYQRYLSSRNAWFACLLYTSPSPRDRG